MTTVTVHAPIAGRVLSMADVPDPVFAESMLGPGVAIEPALVERADVLAPVDGTVRTVLPHAVAVQTAEGHAVLVHLGLDTVELHGAGFVLSCTKGDTVSRGEQVISWSPREVADMGHSVVTAVVALEAEPQALTLLVQAGDEVKPGDALFEWTRGRKAE
jgi:PTS system glucose-specific IIA component